MRCVRERCRMLLAAVLAAVAPGAAAWFVDAEAHRIHDSNIPKAQRSSDILSGSWTELMLTGGHALLPSEKDTLSGSLQLRAADHDRFPGLDYTSYGGTAAWRRKLALGLHAPWVSVSGSAAREDYRQDLRDGDRRSVTFAAGRLFGERAELSGGLTVEQRRASSRRGVVPGISGAVFDLRSRTGFLRAGYDLTERMRLLLGVSVREGEVASSTRRNPTIFAVSTAIAPDPALGPDYIGYRLRGRTTAPSVGLSWSFSEYGSLAIVYGRESTRAAGGLVYSSSVTAATLFYRFQ